ncbi:hypothetical protein [Acinetobacter baumannii]|uniref:hypothetical protein n=1 Tax=Acinetobacter TaxID=469 RepID=UPI0038913C16
MSTELVNSTSIISFPKSCGICESKESVQMFAGLMLCSHCQENIRITNPGLFAANEIIEPKAQD